MGREYRWDLVMDGIPVTVTCEQKGNKYVLYLDDDHLTNIYRLPKKQMPYGLVEDVRIGTVNCKFVVWEEVPDLVVAGRMVHRGVDFEIARENRRRNMENMYTVTSVFGVIILLGVFLFAYFGWLSEETLRGWSAMMMAGLWMVFHGLYYRGKWIEQIP